MNFMTIGIANSTNSQIIEYSDFIKMVVQGIDTAIKELNDDASRTGITYERSKDIRFALPSAGGQFGSVVSFEISCASNALASSNRRPEKAG
jgi:hypothetical protein